jgi:UDP-N-acetylglucosamine 3-dehydrogenase
MMGRHHGRVLSTLTGVDLVAVADAQGDPHGVAKGRPLVASVEELLGHRHRLRDGRGADGVPRGDRH